MNAMQKRLALYVVQYSGTWGWEPVQAFHSRQNANLFMRARRDQSCMTREEEKKFRVLRYMPEVPR